ncbi:MAG TPA: ribosome biogenesis GTPase Der [Polyangia bacterium]|nr:ribosome biogenesis GTPase Der [Polyangia bacterium]
MSPAPPVVAILGRPNVGKSTLFNRLVGRRVAIVEDQPGVTRDRLYAEAWIMGRPVTCVDTGGFETEPEDPLARGINRQCRMALEQADLVLFVVDGQVSPTPDDHRTAEMLRRMGLPCVLVVNKIDGSRQEQGAGDAFLLGLEPAVMVSAQHGRGFADLEELIDAQLRAASEDDAGAEGAEVEAADEAVVDEGEDAIRVAIIGRPNAGKSSLVNRILGADRQLIDDAPGTTRDAVDLPVERANKRYVLVDTAGIRRKRSVEVDGPERLAVSAAVQAMERSRVVVLMVDADDGLAEQDTRVLGLALDRGRAVVIALNKWDLLARDAEREKALLAEARERLAFCPWAAVIRLSVADGRGIGRLFAAIDAAAAEHGKRVSTGELNRLFEDITAHHPPPLRKGRPVKLFYATQAASRPPTFVVHCSYPEALHFSYERYVVNRIRETFGFDGTPVRVFFRKRKRQGD